MQYCNAVISMGHLPGVNEPGSIICGLLLRPCSLRLRSCFDNCSWSRSQLQLKIFVEIMALCVRCLWLFIFFHGEEAPFSITGISRREKELT